MSFEISNADVLAEAQEIVKRREADRAAQLQKDRDEAAALKQQVAEFTAERDTAAAELASLTAQIAEAKAGGAANLGRAAESLAAVATCCISAGEVRLTVGAHREVAAAFLQSRGWSPVEGMKYRQPGGQATPLDVAFHIEIRGDYYTGRELLSASCDNAQGGKWVGATRIADRIPTMR